MAIEFDCKACGKHFKLGDELAKKKLRCKCGQINAIPAAPAATVTPRESADDDGIVGFRDDPDEAIAPPVARPVAARPASPRPVSGASRGAPKPPPLPKATTEFVPDDALESVDEFGDVARNEAPAVPLPPAAAVAYDRPAYASATPSRRPAPAAYGAARPKAKSPGKGLAAKIGGGVLTLFFVLLIIGKVVTATKRLQSLGDTPNTPNTPSSAGGPAAPPAATGPWGFSPPRPTLNLPPRAALKPYGPSLVGEATVVNVANSPTTVRVILPPGKFAPGALPCVFIAPAGSRMFHGLALDELQETRESQPYVDAGFAVVRFSVSGTVDDDLDAMSQSRQILAVRAFMQAEAGLLDARAAIDYTLARFPEIDARRLFTAGHSSAGSIALLVAAKDPRIVACAAYAPCSNVPAFLAPLSDTLDGLAPRFSKMIAATSPDRLPPRCPTLVFHARDDETVEIADSRNYVARSGGQATLVEVASGGHFDAMIEQGIPAGVAFLRGK